MPDKEPMFEKFYQSVQEAILSGHKRLIAREFEVAESTVEGWALGYTRPHPKLRLQIVEWISVMTSSDRKYQWARRTWILSCFSCPDEFRGDDGRSRSDIVLDAIMVGWKAGLVGDSWRAKCSLCLGKGGKL